MNAFFNAILEVAISLAIYPGEHPGVNLSEFGIW